MDFVPSGHSCAPTERLIYFILPTVTNLMPLRGMDPPVAPLIVTFQIIDEFISRQNPSHFSLAIGYSLLKYHYQPWGPATSTVSETQCIASLHRFPFAFGRRSAIPREGDFFHSSLFIFHFSLFIPKSLCLCFKTRSALGHT